jgi:hypothetical protein
MRVSETGDLIMDRSNTEISDFFGKRFFSRSPFRSGRFLTEMGFFVAVMLGSAAFFAAYWNRLPPLMKAFLFLVICVRAVYSMWTALSRHKRLHEAYFEGTSDIPPESPLHAALDVAARAILDDLFYLYNTLLVFLFVVALLLHYSGSPRP